MDMRTFPKGGGWGGEKKLPHRVGDYRNEVEATATDGGPSLGLPQTEDSTTAYGALITCVCGRAEYRQSLARVRRRLTK